MPPALGEAVPGVTGRNRERVGDRGLDPRETRRLDRVDLVASRVVDEGDLEPCQRVNRG